MQSNFHSAFYVAFTLGKSHSLFYEENDCFRIEKLQSFESNVIKINAKLRSFFGANVLHDEVKGAPDPL